jgi:hypothetical protein
LRPRRGRTNGDRGGIFRSRASVLPPGGRAGVGSPFQSLPTGRARLPPSRDFSWGRAPFGTARCRQLCQFCKLCRGFRLRESGTAEERPNLFGSAPRCGLAPKFGPRLWAKAQSHPHRTPKCAGAVPRLLTFGRAAAGPSDTAALPSIAHRETEKQPHGSDVPRFTGVAWLRTNEPSKPPGFVDFQPACPTAPGCVNA